MKLSAGSIPPSAPPRKAKAALDYLPLGSKSFRRTRVGEFLMKRTFILILFAAVALAKPLAERPNFILCMADDQGWGDTGYNGHPVLKTPVMDEMARTGLRFDRFYAAAAVCSPTRAALLTGRHPSRTGVTDWIRPAGGPVKPSVVRNGIEYLDDPNRRLLAPASARSLPLDEITLAEVLSKAGYATAHIGKWHLGGREALPVDQGFDSNQGGC